MDSVADNNSEDELNDFLAGVAPKEDQAGNALDTGI